jgi:hypothetical protein
MRAAAETTTASLAASVRRPIVAAAREAPPVRAMSVAIPVSGATKLSAAELTAPTHRELGNRPRFLGRPVGTRQRRPNQPPMDGPFLDRLDVVT